MSLPASDFGRGVALPRFEQLEERLLLTTLHDGDFFIYYNSQGEAVRVSVESTAEDPSSASVELLAYDEEMGGLVDLVGLMNGDPYLPVNWGGGGQILELDDEGNPTGWLEYNADEGIRGARTEIYLIYIAEAADDTVITISTLSNSEPEGDPWPQVDTDAWETWVNGINPWESQNLPTLSWLDSETGETGDDLTAAESSGGVIVGAKRDTGAEEISFIGGPYELINGGAEGVFPGGEVHPGIIVADGVDVGEIVIGGTLAGAIDTNDSIGTIEMGYLWGDVDVGENLGNLILRQGGDDHDHAQEPENQKHPSTCLGEAHRTLLLMGSKQACPVEGSSCRSDRKTPISFADPLLVTGFKGDSGRQNIESAPAPVGPGSSLGGALPGAGGPQGVPAGDGCRLSRSPGSGSCGQSDALAHALDRRRLGRV